jgi:DNA-binding response OmpR family regulator
MSSSAAPRIAIIDDDPHVLHAVACLIETWGPRCDNYTDGRTALAAIAQAPPDLVVVDIYMPDLDGFEVISRLRHISPATPIISMSGDSLRGQTTHALTMSSMLGLVGTMQKPFPPERLRALIARALQSAAPGTALAERQPT